MSRNAVVARYSHGVPAGSSSRDTASRCRLDRRSRPALLSTQCATIALQLPLEAGHEPARDAFRLLFPWCRIDSRHRSGLGVRTSRAPRIIQRMDVVRRRTVVAHDRLTIRKRRLEAARARRHGEQVLDFERLAARLAGGLTRPVDDESLRVAIRAALSETELGELGAIKDLPGMASAALDTLRKAWDAGIDLRSRASDHPRLGSLAALEAAVLERLPPGTMRPVALVAAASSRLDHAAAVLGPVDILGMTELSPCWRPLLHAIAAHVPVRWMAGPRAVPQWLDTDAVEVVREKRQAPTIEVVSAATAHHEAIEALRWMRRLLCADVDPTDIGIASVSTTDYDDHFLALRADANLDLSFAHGIKVTATREGQAAAALADMLLRGLSQTRMRRLSELLRAYPGPFRALPESWTRVLPADAPLTTLEAWSRLVKRLGAADWPDGRDHGPALHRIVSLLDQGIDAAEDAGETLLHDPVRAIWRKALRNGPAASPRPVTGSACAHRLLRYLCLGRLDAGKRACRLAAAIRISARAQLLAMAAQDFGRPPSLRAHHSHRGARSAPRQRRPTDATSRPFSPPRRIRSFSPSRGATAMAGRWGGVRCSNHSHR